MAAAEVASSKKAERIVILDVSDLLVITDQFVICSGSNERQVKTIAQEIERQLLASDGIKPFRREGEREGRWVLLDYVDFVVHVFLKQEREYYDLERLWGDAPRLVFEDRNERWNSSDEPATAEAT